MLQLRLVTRDGLNAPSQMRAGTMRRTRAQAGLATYRCEFEHAQRSELERVELENYPRWAEPVALLVARAIARMLLSAPLAPHAVQALRSTGSLSVELNSLLLHRVNWRVQDGAISVAGRSVALAEPIAAWSSARAALCLQTTGSLDLPAFPEPFRPPVYDYDGIPYCRLRDLPPEARRAYSRIRAGSTYPGIPGSPDARYAWDVQQFIEGGH